jgi:hypothetical protein
MRRLALIEERAEHFWMAHRQMSVATSTHAESLDAACLEVSDCATCHVDVRDEFLHHHRLRRKPPIAAILIHRGASAIREDDDDLGQLAREDALIQYAGGIHAAFLIPAGSMQVVDDRIALPRVLLVTRRQIQTVADVTLH